MLSQGISQYPGTCHVAQQYQGYEPAPTAIGVDPATPAKRDTDDDVEFISSQPVKKKRVSGHGQGCPHMAQENLSMCPHPPANNLEAPSAVPTPELQDIESTGTVGGLITPAGPEAMGNRGVSLPGIANFSFPKTFPSPPSCPPRRSPAISPKQLPETISPALLSASSLQTAVRPPSFPGPFGQLLTSGGDVGFEVPNYALPPVPMTMELASSYRMLGHSTHEQGNHGAATPPGTRTPQASCQALSPRPQPSASPHGLIPAQTNGMEPTQLIQPSVLNGAGLPRDAGATQPGSPLRPDAQQTGPSTLARANAAPNRPPVGTQQTGLLRHPCIMCARARLQQQVSAGPSNAGPSSPHRHPMSLYPCHTNHMMAPPTSATLAAMPVLSIPLNPGPMVNHSHAVGQLVSPSSNVSGVGMCPTPPIPPRAPVAIMTAQPGPIARGAPKESPTASKDPTTNEPTPSKAKDATSRPPGANAPPERASTAAAKPPPPTTTPAVTPKRKPPPNLVVDVAETAEEVFPFDEVARRHAVPRQKVVDIFAAVVQVPLLRVATDRRRTGKLGQARIKEFTRARKEWAAARTAAAGGAGSGHRGEHGSRNASAHVNGAGGAGESLSQEDVAMMPSNLELAMLMPPLQDVPAQFGGATVPW